MSGSSGGAAAPAASSGPAATSSAAGSGCGGGAGEGPEEAAKDLADIAAFFRSGECGCGAARALGRPRGGGAVRGPRRARCSPARRARRALARATAPRIAAPGPPRRVPLPAPPRAPPLGRDAADSPFPAPAPCPREKLPVSRPRRLQLHGLGRRLFVCFAGGPRRGRRGRRGRRLLPRRPSRRDGGARPGTRALFWAGLGGRFVLGPASTPLAVRFLSSVLQPVTSPASVSTSVQRGRYGTGCPGG